MNVAKKIGAYRYLECSAKDRNPQTNGVNKVFECAARAALEFSLCSHWHHNGGGNICTLL